MKKAQIDARYLRKYRKGKEIKAFYQESGAFFSVSVRWFLIFSSANNINED